VRSNHIGEFAHGRIGCTIVQRIAAAILCAIALCPSSLRAQSLEPRAYSNTPVGLNFLLVGFVYSEGEVGFDPAVPITGAHLHTDTEVVGFSHTLDVLGDSAKFDVVMPYVFLSGSALDAGAPRTRDISGAGDPILKVAVNFFGAPAMSMKEFRDYHQDLIVGASLKVTAPFSQYADTKLVNIGTNRWSFKPELGISKALDPWTLDLYTGVTFYTENTDFRNGGTVQQDPLYSAQAHVMRSLTHGIWLALDGTFYWGGRTTVNGMSTATYQANSRFGTTLAMPISRSMSIKLYAAAGTSTRTRSNFNDAGIFWQYRFGGGF